MTVTTIPFALNQKPGVLEVHYEANQSITKSGFDLFAGFGFDVNLCLGYPTMRAFTRFFAIGFPAEIYDAPCNNLGNLGKLEWTADTFLVTMPGRMNNNTISRIAGFRWGYCEYDLNEKRQVEIKPLAVTQVSVWDQHLPLLQGKFGKWSYQDGISR